MLRYAIFAGDRFFPSGGWDDFIISFATLAEARKAIVDTRGEVDNKGSAWQDYSIGDKTYDWYQIVDLAEPIIVEQS
jgi:hypothetical protein